MSHHSSESNDKERNEKPERHSKAERNERPERHLKVEHNEKPERNERNDLKTGVSERFPHPFLGASDLSMLTVMKPFLSPIGQKFINFFISLNDSEPAEAATPAPDLSALLQRFGSKTGSNPVNEILPAMLGMASGSEQGKVNPALLTALMTLLSNKNEE